MHIDTNNYTALDLLNEAQDSVRLYKQSKELERLKEADISLKKALEADKDYLRARLWRGLVNDLLGESQLAVKELEAVKKAKPIISNQGIQQEGKIQDFFSDVEYNLAVAKYHQYSKDRVGEAVEKFKGVIEQTTNEERIYLAKAWLAKAYAVKMIPKIPPAETEFYKGADSFKNITEYLKGNEPKMNAAELFILSEEESREILNAVNNNNNKFGNATNDIKGLTYDAKAITIMFHTDFHSENRIARLEEALGYLNKAKQYRPRDWAIYCNFGSVHMRLGYWRKVEAGEKTGEEKETSTTQSAENFRKAHEYLDKVITTLRPGYGFALYEKGRAYRLNGNFNEAKIYFDKSLEVKTNRDVSDSILKFEKERAERQITEFP